MQSIYSLISAGTDENALLFHTVKQNFNLEVVEIYQLASTG